MPGADIVAQSQRSGSTDPAPAPASRPDRPCRLVEWKPWALDNPSLCGHATISFSGWTVHRVPLFRGRDGQLSVGSPSAPEIDVAGRVRTNDAGKRQYWPLLTFETKEAKARFERAVLAALADAGVVP